MQSNVPILTLLIFSIFSPIIIENSSAQILADVNLECEGATSIEVYPGASRTGVINCTVDNPTLHIEKISIEIQSGPLANSAPGTITLAAGAEETFQVSLLADLRMPEGAIQVTVTARVQEMSGVPPPNNAESQSNSIAQIRQFAELTLELSEPTVLINLDDYEDDSIWLEYKLFNTGNAFDQFMLELTNSNDGNISTTLPYHKIQVESMGPPHIFRIEIVVPDDGSIWQVNAEGQHTLEFSFDITATSEYSCTNGNCISQTVTQNVVFVQDQTTINSVLTSNSNILIYGGIGGVVLLIPIFFIFFNRKKE
ncbi:MAG: choice-of-anchor T family protein [Candidatus Poseidoniaceae archaeon]|jgi:hypothetical protein|nr:choice-of-anchor T family protein [Candidatus Poseidoniaceae archaeon]